MRSIGGLRSGSTGLEIGNKPHPLLPRDETGVLGDRESARKVPWRVMQKSSIELRSRWVCTVRYCKLSTKPSLR